MFHFSFPWAGPSMECLAVRLPLHQRASLPKYAVPRMLLLHGFPRSSATSFAHVCRAGPSMECLAVRLPLHQRASLPKYAVPRMLLLHGFPRSSATSFAHVCSEIRNILHYFCTSLAHFAHIVWHKESPPPKGTEGIRLVLHGWRGIPHVQPVDIVAHLVSSATASSASL